MEKVMPPYTYKAYAYDDWILYSAIYSVNGKPLRVTFRDGATYPFYRPAEYATTEPLVQQAIESHPSFGKNVRILHVIEDVVSPCNALPREFFPPEPKPESESEPIDIRQAIEQAARQAAQQAAEQVTEQVARQVTEQVVQQVVEQVVQQVAEQVVQQVAQTIVRQAVQQITQTLDDTIRDTIQSALSDTLSDALPAALQSLPTPPAIPASVSPDLPASPTPPASLPDAASPVMSAPLRATRSKTPVTGARSPTTDRNISDRTTRSHPQHKGFPRIPP